MVFNTPLLVAFPFYMTGSIQYDSNRFSATLLSWTFIYKTIQYKTVTNFEVDFRNFLASGFSKNLSSYSLWPWKRFNFTSGSRPIGALTSPSSHQYRPWLAETFFFSSYKRPPCSWWMLLPPWCGSKLFRNLSHILLVQFCLQLSGVIKLFRHLNLLTNHLLSHTSV